MTERSAEAFRVWLQMSTQAMLLRLAEYRYRERPLSFQAGAIFDAADLAQSANERILKALCAGAGERMRDYQAVYRTELYRAVHDVLEAAQTAKRGNGKLTDSLDVFLEKNREAEGFFPFSLDEGET